MTGENIDQFLSLYVDWYFNSSISEQFNSFIKGFTNVLSSEARSLFEWEELYYVVCGKPQLDFSELENGTGYEGYAKDGDFIK